MAAVNHEIDSDTVADLLRLSIKVEDGRRVVQPCLRHRWQTDKVGLTRSHFRLVRAGDNEAILDFEETSCTPLAGALGAVYAVAAMPEVARSPVMDSVRRGLRWHGDIGPELIQALSGQISLNGASGEALADPVGWARGMLGFDDSDGSGRPDRKLVQKRFRNALREAHPDHGAVEDNAADRIAELTEARRILLQ